MQQLEIKFFFPLTEHISLDLDFTPCKEYEEAKRQEQLKNSISYTDGLFVGNGGTWSNTIVNPTFQFRPDPNTVGYWEVVKNVQVHQEKKPRWLVRKMSEFLLGWKWNDK